MLPWGRLSASVCTMGWYAHPCAHVTLDLALQINHAFSCQSTSLLLWNQLLREVRSCEDCRSMTQNRGQCFLKAHLQLGVSAVLAIHVFSLCTKSQIRSCRCRLISMTKRYWMKHNANKQYAFYWLVTPCFVKPNLRRARTHASWCVIHVLDLI